MSSRMERFAQKFCARLNHEVESGEAELAKLDTDPDLNRRQRELLQVAAITSMELMRSISDHVREVAREILEEDNEL